MDWSTTVHNSSLTLLFAVELLSAEYLYLLLFERRERFALRYTIAATVCIAYRFFSTMPPIAEWLTPVIGEAAANAVMHLFWYGSILLLTFIAMWRCFKGSFAMVFSACTAGYATQHFGFKLYDIARTFLPLAEWFANKRVRWLVQEILCHAMVYAAFYFIFVRRAKKYNYKTYGDPMLNAISVAIILTGIGINRFAIDTTARSNMQVLATDLYAMTCCFFALTVQFALLERELSRTELQLSRAMLKEQAQQYEQWKSSLEAIDIKYHDLRHAIDTLKQAMTAADKVDRQPLRAVEKLLDDGLANVHTGSEMLDVLLASKRMLCEKNKIVFSCMADSGILWTANDTELFALFCNAVDNAINAVSRLPEDKRVISLCIRHFGDCADVHIQNYFEGEISYVNGLPAPAEASDIHGFGMISMRRTVSNLGGAMSVYTREGVFHLELLLPLNASDDVESMASNM